MKHPITPLMFAMIVLIAGTAGADPPVPAESADLESFVLEKLELQSGTGVTVLPLTTEAGADFYFFVTSNPNEFPRRGLLRADDHGYSITLDEPDDCYCTSIRAEVIDLVPLYGPFVVTRFSPMTGACVGLDAVRILAVRDDSLVEVWRGATFQASGTESELSTIDFVNLDGDPELEIDQHGTVISCGEDCLCREGEVLEEFRYRFDWDAAAQRFVP